MKQQQKKSLFIVLALAVLGLIIGGIVFYNYRYNQPVTKYYLLTVSQAGPGIKIRGLGSYASEEVAVKALEAEKAKKIAGYNKELEKIDASAPDAYYRNSALINLISEEWILVGITSNRAFNPEEALTTLPKIWNDPGKLKAFIDDNKLGLSTQAIN